jgi:RNA polymerase sigma-70 factor (ECF subfamily)
MSPPASVVSNGAAGLPCVARAWRAHEGELRGYLQHRLADADLADDMLQDVFVKAMRQGQAFCALTNARAWLFQVARNALIDRARTRHPTVPLADDALLADPGAAAPEPVDALAECLTTVIGKLAPQDAALLQACDLQGQTVREYAQQHGLGLAATKSRLLRARQRLRDRLVADCRVGFDASGAVCCHFPRQPAG